MRIRDQSTGSVMNIGQLSAYIAIGYLSRCRALQSITRHKQSILQLLCHFLTWEIKPFPTSGNISLYFTLITLGRCRIRFTNSEMW